MWASSLRLRIPNPRNIKNVLAGTCCVLRYDISTSSIQHQTPEDVQPFHKIPGTGTIQGLFTFLLNDGIAKMHLIEQESRKKYGPIFRQNFGPIKTVYFCNPDTVQQVYKMEGKYPQRDPEIPIWSKYKKDRQRTQGILFSDGETWYQARLALSPKMLKPKEVAEYLPAILEVTDDCVSQLKELRMASSDHTISDMQNVLFKWSLESIGTVLFEKRFGLFKDPPSKEAQLFIDSVHQAFRGFQSSFSYPGWLADYYKTKGVKDLYEGVDGLYKFTEALVHEKMQQIAQRGDKLNENKVDFLTFLIGSKKLTLDKITDNLVDILFPSVDTTSITTLFTLYNLGKNPEKQEKLHKEITSLLKPGEKATATKINQMHYLRGCIRETLRLYPVSVVNTRMIDKDITVEGYNIPKETMIMIPLYTMGRDPAIFDNPLQFRPERWLRGDESQPNYHPFASLTFGHGVRQCIGRRIAMLEMSLLISKLVHQFQFESMNDVGSKVKGILSPDKDVILKLTERQ